MATQPIPQAPWGEYIPRIGSMTVEQFAQMPGEDGWTFELHQGRLIRMPGPGIDHALIQTRLYRTIDVYLSQHQLGLLIGTGCYNLPLPNNTEEVLCPALSYIEPSRMATLPQRGSYLVGFPDLVIEIASPSDTHPMLAAKCVVYLQAGVRLIWVVWPATKTVEIWRPMSTNQPIASLTVNDSLDGAEVIPGFQCAVQLIF